MWDHSTLRLNRRALANLLKRGPTEKEVARQVMRDPTRQAKIAGKKLKKAIHAFSASGKDISTKHPLKVQS